MTAPQPDGSPGVDLASLPHRPLSTAHSIRLAIARDRKEVLVASVPAVVILDDRDLEHLTAAQPSLASARQVTHDRVVALAGQARLTGVAWYVQAGTAAMPLLDASTADLTHPDGLPLQQQMRDLLTCDPHAVLVVATTLVDQRRYRAALS